MQSTSWADRLELVGDDDHLVGFAGALPLRLLAERTGRSPDYGSSCATNRCAPATASGPPKGRNSSGVATRPDQHLAGGHGPPGTDLTTTTKPRRSWKDRRPKRGTRRPDATVERRPSVSLPSPPCSQSGGRLCASEGFEQLLLCQHNADLRCRPPRQKSGGCHGCR